VGVCWWWWWWWWAVLQQLHGWLVLGSWFVGGGQGQQPCAGFVFCACNATHTCKYTLNLLFRARSDPVDCQRGVFCGWGPSQGAGPRLMAINLLVLDERPPQMPALPSRQRIPGLLWKCTADAGTKSATSHKRGRDNVQAEESDAHCPFYRVART
jgi:hypothetical protein